MLQKNQIYKIKKYILKISIIIWIPVIIVLEKTNIAEVMLIPLMLSLVILPVIAWINLIITGYYGFKLRKITVLDVVIFTLNMVFLTFGTDMLNQIALLY